MPNQTLFLCGTATVTEPICVCANEKDATSLKSLCLSLKIVKGREHCTTVSFQCINKSVPVLSWVATQIKSSTMCELSGDPVLR